MSYPCNDSKFAVDCYKYVLGIAQPTSTFVVTIFALITFFAVLINSMKTYAHLSRAMKSYCQRAWFYNFYTCLDKYDITAVLPTDQELDFLCNEARKINLNSRQTNVLAQATQLLQSVPKLQANKDNPTVDRVRIRTLICRPDPSIYSFLSLFTFRYTYLSVSCDNSGYRFGYYYDYAHQKPVLLRLRKEESLFDVICDHLKTKSILAEQEVDRTVLLSPHTTIKVLVLAFHIPYAVGRMTVQSALNLFMPSDAKR